MKQARSLVLPAIRVIGFLALAGMAVWEFSVWTPDGADTAAIDGVVVETDSYEGLTETAIDDYDANDKSTYDDSAPKQTVRNGWLANDLQKVELLQNSELLQAAEVTTANQVAMLELQSDSGHRIATVLLLGVLAVIWHGLTLPWAARKRRAAPDDRRDDLPPPPTGHSGAAAPPRMAP